MTAWEFNGKLQNQSVEAEIRTDGGFLRNEIIYEIRTCFIEIFGILWMHYDLII